MSTQCSRFVQNAWKKELCSNCFKPREEHAATEEALRLNVGKASTNLKTDNIRLQSILRSKVPCQADHKRKSVAFPDSLTEIIGYGGDDFLSDCEQDEEQDGLVEALSPEDETVPDSEEERALGNLTRANTNFNTVTANLTDNTNVGANGGGKSSSATNSSKSFASLMLGRIQKDSEGRKTTLLVSVTPFGGDQPVATAKRPADRKVIVNGFASPPRCKAADSADKSEVSPKCAKKPEQKRPEKLEQKYNSQSCLEKIVDMPLIASNNLINTMQRAECSEPEATRAQNTIENEQGGSEFSKTDTKTIIPPSTKKPEDDKSRLSAQNGDITSKKSLVYPRKESQDRSIEQTNKQIVDRTTILRGREVNKIAVSASEEEKNDGESSVEIRTVEGEATSESIVEKSFSFEESRELAGEPDGMADEEEVSEPPALPRSPPPIESRPSLQGEASSPVMLTEPRPSFLHGSVGLELKTKPVVPQKPTSFSPKSIGCDASIKKVNGGYVPPPPSVQNVAGRSAQNTSLNAHARHEHAPAKDRPEEIQAQSLDQPRASSSEALPRDKACQPNRSPREEQRAKANPQTFQEPPKSITPDAGSDEPPLSPIYKSKPPHPPRSHPTDGRDESLDTEEDMADVQPGCIVDSIRSTNKRRMAPRPPAGEIPDDCAPSSFLFARNPGASLKSDSPVVREKEKRERASSCSPKFRKAVCEVPDPTNVQQSPDSGSRRTISLSQDSLACGPEVREEKKRGRSRFSLKRFLRMGSRKDVDMTIGHASRMDDIPCTPQPKPRLEIIHPLELDGAAVEVLGNDRVSRISEDQTDSCSSRNDGRAAARSTTSTGAQHASVRPGKPPPPPRNQSLEDWSRLDPASKPVRPPPPRVEAKQLPPRSDKLSSKSSSWQPTASTTSDSIYANLGEVRSSLAPSKPQRTASMRDQAASQPVLKKHAGSSHVLNQDYETLVPPTSDSPTSNDSHVYECLSSSPECDSNLELRHGSGSHLPCKRKSDSSAMEAAVEFKFHHQPFVRSTSLPYCGSETESELYAPYSFYTGDEGAEEDQDWKNKDDELRMSRLRQRRGRSIVHRSLEDNYGAVVVANHEALAQFLEQLNQTPQVPMGLRALKNTNPRLSHFNIDPATSITVGKRIFCSASWNEQNVTLCIAFDLATHVSRKEFYLAPVIEFIDSVPKEITDKTCLPGNKDAEATISVLPRLQVGTIQSFGAASRDAHDEGATREASFVLLQFVNALKSLQARGIEEASKSLNNVVLCREDKDSCYRLYLLQGLNIDTGDEREEERVSLCQCALVALQQLHLTSRLPLVKELLMREKAVTLSQVKSLLEFSLWGPADVTLGGPREREVTLQRWLDLERATVLHALVRTRASLTVTDEYQLLFLVRTSAKIMGEASLLLDEQRSRLARIR
ncbi:hypothetical protein KM043_006741 [Ampulex compressa]|nr:hypothetical protein KM043_006741 [Ampulex compressa]